MTGVVEGRLERGEGSSCVPVRVGNDGDGLIEAHDAFHARHRLGRGGVDGRELAAVDRRDLDGGVEHARQGEIDAIDRAAVDLRGDVQTRPGSAPDGVRVGTLQRRTRRDGNRGGCRRKLSEACALPRSLMDDTRSDCLALRHPDAEACRSGGEQHVPGSGARHGHAVLPGAANGRGAASHLGAEPARQAIRSVVHAPHERCGNVADEGSQHVRVGVGIEGRCLPDPHQIPVSVHFLGGHHGQRRLRPLAHLAVGDQNGDEIIRRDRDPGGELTLFGGIGRYDALSAGREQQLSRPQHETASNQGAGADESASRPFPHNGLLVNAG